MKLLCIKTVMMKDQENYQAFTEGNIYNARKGDVKGLNGNPYEFVRVLRCKNDKGESHIIKHLDEDDLSNFFATHFQEIKKK